MEAHFYNVNINWKSGRQGTICSPEVDTVEENDDKCIVVATPSPFPNGVEGIWSPEHLFTASVSSCLMTTFLAIAENSRLEFSGFSCASKGKLEKVDGKLVMSEVILIPSVTVHSEKQAAKAERILHKSEAACLISNSITSKVTMEIKVMIDEAA